MPKGKRTTGNLKSKISFISIFILLAFSAFFAFSNITGALAEREVKVFKVGKDGSEVEVKTGRDKYVTEELANVHDFESGILKNNLGGDSGAWDIEPYDDSEYCEPEIVEMEGPEDSTKSLKLIYDVSADYPASNGFWTKLKYLDASGYDRLEFDVKGDEAMGYPTKFQIEIKKWKDKEKRVEKIKGGFLVEGVTSEWQRISIPLNKMTGILDFGDPETWKNPAISRRNLDELVIVFKDRLLDVKEGAIYIDNIRFIATGEDFPTAVDFPPRKGMKTPVQLEGLDFAKWLVARLNGYPEKVIVKKKFPGDDREFLMEIAKDTWKFFDNIVDAENQLPLDTVKFGKDAPISEDGFVGDYTNVTNIGVYLMCLVSAYDFGFITRDDCIARINKTLSSVESVEHHKSGFLYNYYDTTTLERTSYFVSFVDSGWFMTGLYIVKNAFPAELGKRCEEMLARRNMRFFYDNVEQQMYHGYYDNLECYSDYHYGCFYTEPRAISLIAIARGDVPPAHWYKTIRTFPENFYWQTMEPLNRQAKEWNGVKYYGGYYEWDGIKYVPSWGGSMFEALMPTMVVPEKELAPESLGKNDANHALVQIEYAKEHLGYPVWGMSPSAVPGEGYSEFGVKVLGSKGYKPGVVTPHATFLTLEFAPEEAIENARELLERYDIYGEYGFYDAVNVETGKVAYKYLCLDQAMIFISLNNYLNDGAIRKRFKQDPIFVNAVPFLAEENLFE